MNNNEQLLFDYLMDGNGGIYTDGKIVNVNSHGGFVTCDEISECGYYEEHHTIECFDILVWMHNK